MGQMKSKLKYFVVRETMSSDRILLFNSEHTSLFQARYFACNTCFRLTFCAPCVEDIRDDFVVITPVSGFERAFRSVLPFMEKLPDFDEANYDGVKSYEDLVEKLKQECAAIEANTSSSDSHACNETNGGQETFLTIMKCPDSNGKKNSFVHAYDSRDFSGLKDAQHVEERLDISTKTISEEERNKFCTISTLDAFERVFDGIEWVRGEHEVLTAHRQTVLEHRAATREGNSYVFQSENQFYKMMVGYISPKKQSNRIIYHTGDKDVQLRVHPNYSNPEDFKDKTYIWYTKDYRPTSNGKNVQLCVPMRKLCDGNHISYVCSVFDGKSMHHHDESDKQYLRTLKRLCVHSGGMTRDEIAEDFFNYYIKAEQLEEWGTTPYTVDIKNAVITPVKFSDKKGKYIPFNLKEGNYDTLHFIAEDELEETNLLTLTPDNLDEMKPLLEILSDRYTIQATEVRKKQKLHVTVL